MGSLFGDILGLHGSSSAYGPHDDFWYGSLGSLSAAGIKVTDSMAMQISTLNACIRLISETMASLPLNIFKRLPNGDKEPAPDHPLQRLLHLSPNDEMTAFTFIESMQGFLSLRGNAYAEIIPSGVGEIESLRLLPSTWVEPVRLTDGAVAYKVTEPISASRPHGGETRRIRSELMFHVPGLSFNGIVGINQIQFAANALGLTLAAEQYGSGFFKRDANPGGVFKMDKSLSDKAYKRLKRELKKHSGSANAKSTMILEEGLEWQQIGIAPEEAQFLETRKFQDLDICKMFRVPPPLVGILDSAKFKNVENLMIQFAVFTISPLAKRWEQEINRQLIVDDDTYFAKFNINGLLRGDAKTRSMFYKVLSSIGVLNINEIRNKEGMNSVGDMGEKRFVPLNMAPLDDDGLPITPKDTNQRATEPNNDISAPGANSGGLLKPFAEDVASRIVSAELRGLENIISKGSRDRRKLNKKIEDFYTRHEQYVSNVLAPLELVYAEAGVIADFEDILFTATHQGMVEITDTTLNPGQCLDGYRQDDFRLKEITGLLTEGME